LLWATLSRLALVCPTNYIKTSFCPFSCDKFNCEQIYHEFLLIGRLSDNSNLDEL
jgi:hypothetical protein